MRVVALDSLRGVAALAVVVFHSLQVFPSLEQVFDGRGWPYASPSDLPALLLTVAPPALLWAGREAVILFFVLSGFVLALPFVEGTARPRWLSFAAKRLVRLILPCAAVAILLGVAVPLIDPSPRPDLSGWFNSSWAEPVTLQLVAGHAALLLDEYALNNPMWSLHYELRISLVFPLLMIVVALGPGVTLAATAAGVLACLVEMKFIGTGLLTTLLFMPHFVLGALLARHREQIAAGLTRTGAPLRLALWLLCYALLILRWLVPAGDLVVALANGAGSALLIALILASPRLQAALVRRPLPWLGAISYSLYLVHVPVLLAGLHLAPKGWPAWAVATAAPLVSLLLATVLHRAVERPAITLGRRIGEWIDARRHIVAART